MLTSHPAEPRTLHPDTFSSLFPGDGGRRSHHGKGGHSHRRSYPHAAFDGSLTTPPCTEGLSWCAPDHILHPRPFRCFMPTEAAAGAHRL
jgi:hypothetical protein